MCPYYAGRINSLCELQRRQGNIELVAFLACDIKQ
ncbi:Hok/Gef family protein [Klebsiella pneumoniae]|nr:Hok/Gef family protein [Klebsiella pneumoniae]